MSTSNTKETEELIIKLLRKLERKGKNIQSLLWQLMDKFEEEQLDEKKDESKVNINDQKITLLYDETAPHVCKVGHLIKYDYQKHLSIDPCIMCGHRNSNSISNKPKQEILHFLNQYNTPQIPFGSSQNHKETTKRWTQRGAAKQWPLHYAAVCGDIATINDLCKNKNINVDQKRTDFADKTPIAFAARYGQLESVIELIKNGANHMPTPDKSNRTPYSSASYHKHKAITVFFAKYIQFLYNFDINDDTNLECYKCYMYDLHFDEYILNGTMTKYVYCKNCASENVAKMKEKQEKNKIIERRIIKTLKENASISVDTLCQMKDVKALHSILRDIVASGSGHAYCLWLLDIDNFKTINSHLTHAIADTKIQSLGEILKKLERKRYKQWKESGYEGLFKVWAFRQGGDEFALVTYCNAQKKRVLQKLYETLKNNINKIKLENVATMKHITVSIGVCIGQSVENYQDMMKKADDAAEIVKKDGKNGIAIYHAYRKKIYKSFNW